MTGGASQMCPGCGSPLSPCRCEKADEYLAPPGALANSTLGVRKGKRLKSSTRLRARTLEEKYGDDDLRYGPLFEEVRRMECAGNHPGHECGPGYAPASAHHLDDKGHLDAKGLIPCCGRLHDVLEDPSRSVEWTDGRTTEEVGRFYVLKAAHRIRARGEMTEELEQAIREAA